MFPAINLPALSRALSNAASILPLSALIEFVDTGAGLHIYELCGFQSVWGWPVTPNGARALLSGDQSMIKPCFLDRGGKVPAVECIDGRWGDRYPCISSHTLRLCSSISRLVHHGVKRTAAWEKSMSQLNSRDRPIRLTVICVKLIDPSLGNAAEQAEPATTTIKNVKTEKVESAATAIARDVSAIASRRRKGMKGQHGSFHFLFISTFGWLIWIGLTVVSFMSARWFSAAWLVVVVLCGFIIRYTHGHSPRRLLDVRDEEHPRLVVTADSMNATEWTAYIGGHKLVDSLLNKPFYRASGIHDGGKKTSALWILRFCIAAQWVFIVVACANADWDAFFITFWIAFCCLNSVFGYHAKHAIRDWLRANNIKLSRCQVEMRNRRVMLSTLVALNPDRMRDGQRNTRWITPILAESNDRREWEETLYRVLDSGSDYVPDANVERKYWWPFIQESQEAAEIVNSLLELKQDP